MAQRRESFKRSLAGFADADEASFCVLGLGCSDSCYIVHYKSCCLQLLDWPAPLSSASSEHSPTNEDGRPTLLQHTASQQSMLSRGSSRDGVSVMQSGSSAEDLSSGAKVGLVSHRTLVLSWLLTV